MADKAIENPTIKKKENRLVKLLSNIGFTIFMVIMAFLIFVTAQSRLTGQEPSLLGHRIYIVDSGSMEPTVPINSMIGVKETTAEVIEVGDVITYKVGVEGIRVTHRVVDIIDGEDGRGFITKGDANNAEDPNILHGDQIVGRLAFKIPYIGFILRGLSTRLGIILIGFLGLAIIIVPIITKKFKYS